MGFPDDFVFCGNKTAVAKQIGNAIPPHLAAAIAAMVQDMLIKPQPPKAEWKEKDIQIGETVTA
jgi:DNA (cytosine-5)-methyltransferase 1